MTRHNKEKTGNDQFQDLYCIVIRHQNASGLNFSFFSKIGPFGQNLIIFYHVGIRMSKNLTLGGTPTFEMLCSSPDFRSPPYFICLVPVRISDPHRILFVLFQYDLMDAAAADSNGGNSATTYRKTSDELGPMIR